jgi:hypothetical protein
MLIEAIKRTMTDWKVACLLVRIEDDPDSRQRKALLDRLNIFIEGQFADNFTVPECPLDLVDDIENGRSVSENDR